MREGRIDGNTLDFMLSAKPDAKTAKRFLHSVLNASHPIEPSVITVNKNAAYPPAISDFKTDEALPETTETRQYLNNTVEQDHHFIKRRTKPGLGFGSFNTARRSLKGYEAMNMIRKGQIEGAERSSIMAQISFIKQIFGVTEQSRGYECSFLSSIIFCNRTALGGGGFAAFFYVNRLHSS